jgi:RNA polymerase sigma-70 factor (ECF subfamily)
VVEDALHDAFVVIFTSLDSLRDDSKAEAWMVSIARNIALKCNDHNEIPLTISLDEISEVELPPSEEGETNIKGLSSAEVIKLIDKLPEGYKQVFRLSVFEGLTHKEIAAMLGIEPHSSSSQLTRAKQMLRKMMQQYWVLLLLLLLPATLLLIKKRDSRLEPIAITNNENAEESVEQPIDDTGITVNHTPATKPEHTSAFEDTIPLHLVDIKDAHALADTMSQIMVDSIPKDPVTPSPYVKELTPNDYIAELAETPIKKQTKHKWQIAYVLNY